MSAELVPLLDLATSRNVLIQGLLKDGSFYTPMNPQTTQMARSELGIFFADFTLEGVGNLVHARELAVTNKVTIVGNHINPGDTIARRLTLELAGYGDIVDRAVYLAELKWYEDKNLRKWIGADHTIYVIPPQDLDDIKALKLEDLPESFREILVEYRAQSSLLNKAAQAKLAELTEGRDGEERKFLTLYPEADFQRDGFIRRAPVGISILFSRRDGEFILPILTTGPEKLTSLTEPMKRSERPGVHVIVGEPFPSYQVWVDGLKGEVKPVDRVMASIVRLNESYIHPEYLKLYRPLIDKLSKFLQLQNLNN